MQLLTGYLGGTVHVITELGCIEEPCSPFKNRFPYKNNLLKEINKCIKSVGNFKKELMFFFCCSLKGTIIKKTQCPKVKSGQAGFCFGKRTTLISILTGVIVMGFGCRFPLIVLSNSGCHECQH